MIERIRKVSVASSPREEGMAASASGDGTDNEMIMKTIPRKAIKSLFPKKEIIYILTAYPPSGVQEPEYITLVCKHGCHAFCQNIHKTSFMYTHVYV